MNKKQKGFVLWFTGLPCSGKTTLARAVRQKLLRSGYGHVQHLDGDGVRRDLCAGLGFSRKDRETNVARVAFVASLLAQSGVPTVVSLVSPYRVMRERARKQVHPASFVEIYVGCPLQICEKRDVKGLYRLARQGRIQKFTGVSDTYEPPRRPQITLATDRSSVRACVDQVFEYINRRFKRPF